jgi:thiosulfate/3-mercaptopyruvate sulfurtransferase
MLNSSRYVLNSSRYVRDTGAGPRYRGGMSPRARLVSTAWLAAHLDEPLIRVVDARWGPDGAGRRAYDARHLPGAVHLDWERDLAAGAPDNRYRMAAPEVIAERLGRLGIGDGRLVVAYADPAQGGPYRLWWVMRRLGHASVRVLDGGWPRWLAEGRPTSRAVPRPAPERLSIRAPRAGLATATDLERRRRGRAIVDARPAEQHAGHAVWCQGGSEPVDPRTGWAQAGAMRLRGGRIPGSLGVPSTSLFRADGRMLPPARLRTLLAAAGVLDRGPVTTYCGAAIAASTLAFALIRAGWSDVALYDASWEEWGRDERRPVEHDRG